jgi:hypothetical protein
MDYKYEVAFSLEKEDIEIVRQINNLIKNRISTFTYFENKEETAAQDGLDLFYNVFNNQSKIVIVMFSNKWGKTDWTTKEEIAIRNRIVKTNWDFIIFVKLDNKIETPSWYPLSHIWVDYEKYGIKGIASVIEFKVRELGGKIKSESLIEKAKRISDEKENLTKIRKILTDEGIERANSELIKLFALCKERIKDLTNDANKLYFSIKIEEHNYIQIKATPYVLNIHWWPESTNSHLDISLKKKIIKGLRFEEHYEDVNSSSYVFNINPSWENGWSINNYNGKIITSEMLIDFWLNIILDRIK